MSSSSSLLHVQIEVHPRYQQTSLRGFCAQHGIAVVAYASLGCGSLLGHETVLRLSHRLGRTPAQVLFCPNGCLHICLCLLVSMELGGTLGRLPRRPTADMLHPVLHTCRLLRVIF